MHRGQHHNDSTMECSNLIQAALKKGDISKQLFIGSNNKELIVDLQRTLFELGFRRQLKWDNYQADGDYGKATASAVAAFATKNKLNSDGSKVSNALAKVMLQHHDFLPVMYVLWDIHQSDLRTRIYLSKTSRMSVTALQVLLNIMGFGKQLNFEKYGADGLYGKSTRNAVIAYANANNIRSDGDLLTRPMVNLLLKDINTLYGKNWKDQAQNNLPSRKSPLVLFQGSHFSGKPCRADEEFVPSLEKINQYASDAGVQVFVTSSFRTSTNVEGAIVKPAVISNHLAGHGIDMNLVYGKKQFANSRILAKYPAVPAPVKQFLKSVIEDPDLRWGGKFRNADPVHIDDGLNRNRAAWDARYEAMQKAVQLGK